MVTAPTFADTRHDSSPDPEYDRTPRSGVERERESQEEIADLAGFVKSLLLEAVPRR